MSKKMKSADENFQADIENSTADQNDSIETLTQKNQDLQGLLSKVIDLLKEKTNVCINLEKQNSALNLQILSLKDIVAITKNLLGIRNVEVENMQKDLASLQEKINAEKERHNQMIDKIGNANKLNEDIKNEYQNQMNLFQKLREKYNEKVFILNEENEKLRKELHNIKLRIENRDTT